MKTAAFTKTEAGFELTIDGITESFENVEVTSTAQGETAAFNIGGSIYHIKTTDTVTVNGEAFTGTALELKNKVMSDVIDDDTISSFTRYVGFMSQSGTDAPEFNEVSNTGLGTLTAEYFETGVYYVKAADDFPIGRTVVLFGNGDDRYFTYYLDFDIDSRIVLAVQCRKISDNTATNGFSNIPVIIEVYPV